MIHWFTSLKKWWKKRARVFKDFAGLYIQVQLQEQNITRLANIIKDRTTINVDVASHPKDPSMVIFVGRYKDNDYVRVTPLRNKEFADVVDYCKKFTDHTRIGRIDASSSMQRAFRNIIEHP